MPKKILIIGAGPGGLASAMLLAKAGLNVTVLERKDRVGGRTGCITEEGYKFDLGPTFFLYPQILEEIFQSVGRDLRREVDLRKLDPQYRLIFGEGGQLDATPDVDRMVAEIAKLAPKDAPNFKRFMADNRVKLEHFSPCLQMPFPGWQSLMQARLLSVLPFLKPWKSLHAELAGYFDDPRLQLAFTFQSKYLGMSPYQCPSLFSILSFLEYEYGVFHPIGGCNAVVEAMARVARDLGAEVRLNEPVEEVLVSGRRVTGVRTHTGKHEADAVVVNADFGHFMKNLIPNNLRRRWNDAALAKKRFSCSTFMMYLGIEGTVPEMAHHTIYVAKDYRQNLLDVEQHHVLSDDPSYYVQNACVTDPTLAPAGHSTLYVLLPVSHQHPNIDWTTEAPKYRQVALRQLAKIGLTDIEKRIRFERIITPADWESGMGIYRGATFNLAHNLTQMLNFRPRNRFEELDGMYLVGGGTHPGSGLPVIFEGARITSNLVLEEMG